MTIENHTPDGQLEVLNAMVAKLSPEAQTRVWVTFNILEEMLAADTTGEVELAFTLVMAELANG